MSRVSPTQKNTAHVEVLSPKDNGGANARNITAESNGEKATDNRSVGEGLGANQAASSNNNSNPENNNASSSIPGFNAFQNMVGRGRAAVDKAGNTLMWGAGGIAGLLYLGLGWRKLALVIGGLGIGSGYLLKSKVATLGQQADLDKVLIKTINAMKISAEDIKKVLEFMDGILSKYR